MISVLNSGIFYSFRGKLKNIKSRIPLQLFLWKLFWNSIFLFLVLICLFRCFGELSVLGWCVFHIVHRQSKSKKEQNHVLPRSCFESSISLVLIVVTPARQY